ncbi:MAG TPA: hypothetical protein VMC08_03095 [Bacteroidales bacterium]|nr:hypothetical protein [Bacteroidales bacterium]
MFDLLKYPPKVLVAWGETFFGNKELMSWLMSNGYPELAALSYAIQGSEDAFDWLMNNGFPHLAALDSAIDEDVNAYTWLRVNKYLFSLVFSDACHAKPYAVDWFNRHSLQVILRIAQRINELRNSKTFDYHKLHF